MKKKTLLMLMATLMITSGFAQRENPEFVSMTSKNELLIGFKTSTFAIYGLPELNLIKEFTLGDPKSKIDATILSPNGDKLIVYNSKTKSFTIWNTETGTLAFSINDATNPVDNPAILSPNGDKLIVYSPKIETYTVWNLATGTIVFSVNEISNRAVNFVGADKVYFCQKKADRKIPLFVSYNLETGQMIESLDRLETFFFDMAFSPSGKRAINFDKAELNVGGYRIFNVETGEIISKGKIGENSCITKNTSFINEDTIRVVWNMHMGPMNGYTFNIPASVKDFVIDKGLTNYQPEISKGRLRLDFSPTRFTDGKNIIINMGSEYRFNGASTMTAVSNDAKWSILVSSKKLAAIYDNQDFKQYKIITLE